MSLGGGGGRRWRAEGGGGGGKGRGSLGITEGRQRLERVGRDVEEAVEREEVEEVRVEGSQTAHKEAATEGQQTFAHLQRRISVLDR